MKVAIVYDRVNKWGGAERVLLALHGMFPEAPLYTSVYDKKNASWAKVFPRIYTSFLQYIPFAKSNHEFLSLLMPLAFSFFNFDNYDLVISVTSEFAKNIKTNSKTLHVCYCLTPTRYLWSHYGEYFENQILKIISKPIVHFLKIWDKKSGQKPDVMIAISTEVKNRIKKYYKRDSEVIFPPVDIQSNIKNIESKRKYFLVVSRLVKYKKVDLVINTFNKLGYQLVIVGAGREERYLKSIAHKNIKFAGQVTEKELYAHYQNAKALVMPQEEDFGIVAIEAQSFGIPVISFSKGGVLDTVTDGKTGVFFDRQTVEDLTSAIEKLSKISFNDKIVKANAKRFSKEVFKRQLQRSLVRFNYSRRRRNPSLAGFKI